MKKLSGLLMIVAVLFSYAVAISAQQETTEPAATTETAATTEEAAKIPDNTDMTLGFKDSKAPVMPATFRGGDPDSGLVHCLEDVYYEKQEHALIYKENAGEIAEGATFKSDPNITWDTKVKDADGNWVTMSTANTNMASDGGKFFAPGEYQIGNSGARQVGGGSGADDTGTGAETPGAGNGGANTDTTQTGNTTPGDGTGGANTDTALVGADGKTAGDEVKTVTAQQSMGVQVHDVTSPDMWVAFQEGAGNVDMASTEQELKTKMVEKIISTMGRPFSSKADDYEDASYVFVDEGAEDERNKEPFVKTARLSVAGALFNERGAPKFETKLVDSKTLDEEKMTRQVHVAGGENTALKGVYVRRNVPFIFAAMAVDNGDNRGKAGEAASRIETADGTPVEKIGNGYLFRVPNFPRADYSDQPEYFFVAKGTDESGNLTTVRMPLYVVNTQAAFEGGRNQ